MTIEKQIRMVLKEEFQNLEGYNELSLQEKIELEEGVMDFLRGAKANVAGGLAGFGAKAKGLASGVGSFGRNIGGLAKYAFTGDSPGELKKGPTKYDAAAIGGLTKAQSLVKSFLKQFQGTEAAIKGMQDKLAAQRANAAKVVGDINFGKMEAQVKPQALAILKTSDPKKLASLDAALEKAKAGDLRGLAALSLDAKPEDIGKTVGGKTITVGDSKRKIVRPPTEAPPTETPLPIAAEELAESVINQLILQNKKIKYRR